MGSRGNPEGICIMDKYPIASDSRNWQSLPQVRFGELARPSSGLCVILDRVPRKCGL